MEVLLHVSGLEVFLNVTTTFLVVFIVQAVYLKKYVMGVHSHLSTHRHTIHTVIGADGSTLELPLSSSSQKSFTGTGVARVACVAM